MRLNAIIDGEVYALEIPDPLLGQATGFFDQLDRDLDRGCQMSREWVDAPDRLQRCRVVADKLLTALETENQKLGLLMAGYLLSRLPNLDAVEIDAHGEMQNTLFTLREPLPTASAVPADAAPVNDAPPAATQAVSGQVPGGLGKIAAMTQAGQDVTKVFKVGRGWRFSVFDHVTSAWQDSPLIGSEAEAERLRALAFKARYERLQQ